MPSGRDEPRHSCPMPISVSLGRLARCCSAPRPARRARLRASVIRRGRGGIATMAAVVRDEVGNFQGASVVVIEGISDPEMAQAMACRERVLLSRKFKLATDCANVVRSLQGHGMGPYGHIIREIKARKASFVTADIVYECRGSNGDAHRLAKSSIYETLGRHVWFLTPPDGVCTSIAYK
ncbi:hypothetical protein EJB05_31359, partial [Eragrostis curvula]